MEEMISRAIQSQLDMDVARRLSEFVSATYCTPENIAAWNCSRCSDDLEMVSLINDPIWDLLGVVGWSKALDGIVISFRGTDSHSYYSMCRNCSCSLTLPFTPSLFHLSTRYAHSLAPCPSPDWVENMRTWRTDLSLSYDGMPHDALVHGGFFYSYNDSSLAMDVSAAVQSIMAAREDMGAGGGGGGTDWGRSRGGSPGNHLWPSSVLQSETVQIGGRGGRGGRGSRRERQTEGREQPEEQKRTTPTVFVSGHSLGGALATFCALEMKLIERIDDVRVVTFGSPRVGNAVFAEWFKETIPQHVRFTHNRDMCVILLLIILAILAFVSTISRVRCTPPAPPH